MTVAVEATIVRVIICADARPTLTNGINAYQRLQLNQRYQRLYLYPSWATVYYHSPIWNPRIAERGCTDEADSRVAGSQRYFYHGEYLRASGFAVQEPERPDDGKHTDAAESDERKRMVR